MHWWLADVLEGE
jgi:hypothetical protein